MPNATCPCGQEHPAGASFYVTCVNGPRVAYLAGPFPDHPAALAMVKPAQAAAERVDPWAVHYAFGTASIAGGSTRQGALNAALGLALDVPNPSI